MKKIILQMLLVIASVGFVQAQTQVTGKVVGGSGEPLDYVSVLVKEVSGAGTHTDAAGNFTINVPAGGQTLVFSYMGFATQEIVIGSRAIINASLVPEAIQMEGGVVVAYGVAAKESITGAVTQISSEKLEQKNQSEVTKALAGEIPGVQVINTSGQPGMNATVRIRGFGSANSSMDPLYVVDGTPFDGDISSINPADIATTSVLKDAASAALYGARAANGVIMITTKRGKKDVHIIDVDVQTGVNIRLIPLYDVIQTPERFIELGWESLRNYAQYSSMGYSASDAAQWASLNVLNSSYGIASGYNMWNTSPSTVIDPVTGLYSGAPRKYTPESWSDHMFRTGIKREASVRFSGGSENLNYFTSFGGLKEDGYYVNSGFDRLSARTNLEYKPKTWLKATTNMAYTYMKSDMPGQTDNMNNGFQFVNYMPPIYPVFVHDADGNIVFDELTGQNKYDYGMHEGYGRSYAAGINPIGSNKLDVYRLTSHQITGNVNFEISFLKDFKFNSLNGLNYLIGNYSILTNPYYGDAEGLGRIQKVDQRTTSITATQMLSYTKQIAEKHNISAFVAHETSQYKYSEQNIQKSMLARPNDLSFNNAVIMNAIYSYEVGRTIESFFGQIKYNYDGKYFADFNVRRDGSSRFSKNKWGTFASGGAAWLVTKEKFMEKLTWLNTLRLKASYGTFGNEAILTGNTIANYYPTQNIYTISNANDLPAYAVSYLGNPELSWENSTMLNAGIDFRLFNRISGEIDVYSKVTSNMLFLTQVPISLGYASAPTNDAKMNNSGIEFNLNFQLIKTEDLNLDFNINGAHYTNKLTEMPMDGTSRKIIEDHGAFFWSKDHSIYDYYIREYAGVDPADGLSQWYAYYDVAGGGNTLVTNVVQYQATRAAAGETVELEKRTTKNYADAGLNYVGKSAIPDISGGFGLNFRYKNFSAAAQFVYSVGGYGLDAVYQTLMANSAFSAGYNWHTDMEYRWTQPGQVTNVPRLSSGYDTYAASTSTRFLTSNTYLGLNNVRLSYDLPKTWIEKININRLTVWVSADNLYYKTARHGYLPLVSTTGQVGRSTYIPLTTIMGGIKLQF